MGPWVGEGCLGTSVRLERGCGPWRFRAHPPQGGGRLEGQDPELLRGHPQPLGEVRECDTATSWGSRCLPGAEPGAGLCLGQECRAASGIRAARRGAPSGRVDGAQTCVLGWGVMITNGGHGHRSVSMAELFGSRFPVTPALPTSTDSKEAPRQGRDLSHATLGLFSKLWFHRLYLFLPVNP